MVQRRAASEFPNDNPELHDGLVWASDSVCGAALPTLRLRPLSGRLPKVLGPSWDAPGPAPSVAPKGMPAAQPRARPAPSAAASRQAEPDTVLGAFVKALVRVALDRGATRLAAVIPELIAGREMPAELRAERSEAVLGRVAAWRGVLDGTTPDLGGCGDEPLDVWAADLLALLLSVPAEREALRRSLRKHGVAAFGMRQASAA
jgi:hypothetical protein